MDRVRDVWHRLHRWPWYARWAVKWAILAVTIGLVAYPYPHLLVRNIQRWRDPNALVEPNAPELQPMARELDALLTPELPPRKALNTVERYVNGKIRYAWDWDVWGVADYLPTVSEVIAEGREDCDGRAVIAASLLRRLGYKADLVSDFAHVWVKTDKGETMSPGKRKSLVATGTGLRMHWKTIMNVPRALINGLAPFPLGRELIVLAMTWLLLLRPGVGRRVPAIATIVLLSALLLLRWPALPPSQRLTVAQTTGVFLLAAGIGVMLVHGRRVAGRVAASVVSPPS